MGFINWNTPYRTYNLKTGKDYLFIGNEISDDNYRAA